MVQRTTTSSSTIILTGGDGGQWKLWPRCPQPPSLYRPLFTSSNEPFGIDLSPIIYHSLVNRFYVEKTFFTCLFFFLRVFVFLNSWFLLYFSFLGFFRLRFDFSSFLLLFYSYFVLRFSFFTVILFLRFFLFFSYFIFHFYFILQLFCLTSFLFYRYFIFPFSFFDILLILFSGNLYLFRVNLLTFSALPHWLIFLCFFPFFLTREKRGKSCLRRGPRKLTENPQRWDEGEKSPPQRRLK